MWHILRVKGAEKTEKDLEKDSKKKHKILRAKRLGAKPIVLAL